MQFDPDKIGLKVGLEIHQQLGTSSKLFCECPVLKSDDLPYSFRRRLRPAQSEVGRVDPAAVFEFTKGKANLYLWSPESSCLVEADEEPPHRMREEAVDAALLVAKLLHSNTVDEIHVMRKIVIDGSNTTGFQRTAVIGIGGRMSVAGKEVGVQSVTLEEDAARIMGEDESERRFALDRLGVPLVEVALDPVTGTPETIGTIALHLGRALRSTGRVARGLGTIRQDLNISIMGGSVVEVKGVQKLNLLPKVVEYEALRQLALVRVASKLKEAGGDSVKCRVCDVSPLLSGTSSRVLRKQLADDGKVACISAPHLAGLLGWEPYPGVRLGREVAEVARANSLGGVIHSDEFTRQGISETEEAAIRKESGAGKDAALVLLAGPTAKVDGALRPIAERLEHAPRGVPAETRAATEDGETRYMRPRPGAQRMYPETDIPDMVVTAARLREVERHLPEQWDARVKRYKSAYALSHDMALKLYDSGYAPLFERLVSDKKVAPSVLAATLVDLPVRLVREGVDEARIDDTLLIAIVGALAGGKVAKEAAFDVALFVGTGKAKTVDEAIGALGIRAMSEEELETLVDAMLLEESEMIRTKGGAAFSPLMGLVMDRARGRADGQLVSGILRQKLKSALHDD